MTQSGDALADQGVTMRDLRLIGIHEDGAHLLLASDDGARFRVRIDDAVRAAVRRERPRQGQLGIPVEGDLRPRDVQAMVRSGMGAEEIAERTGWAVERIRKYEGAILAEREHVAGLAQGVRLRARGFSAGRAPTLAARVSERLSERGVDRDAVGWDSWRSDTGAWVVVASFPAGGRERQATWTFDPGTRSLAPRDDEARWLAEDEPAAAPVPAARAVYDVEADGGVDAPAGAPAPAPAHRTDDAELVSSVREHSTVRARRGGARRRHTDPALPLGELPGPAGADAPVPHDAPEPEPTDDERPAPRRTEEPEPRPAPGPAGARRPGRTPVPSWEDVVFGARSPSGEPE